MEYGKAIIMGFGAGVAGAGIGYLKSGEDFDGVKFTKTALMGGVLGALGKGIGLEADEAQEIVMYPFVILIIDICAKAIWRRALKPLKDKLQGLE